MTGRGHPLGEVEQLRDLVEQVVDAHAARSLKRRAGWDVRHRPIAYVAAILTSMSTPPTPAPPPRREGRRFAIPTPADLRHPDPDAARPRPTRARGHTRGPAGRCADAEPGTSSEEVPDRSRRSRR